MRPSAGDSGRRDARRRSVPMLFDQGRLVHPLRRLGGEPLLQLERPRPHPLHPQEWRRPPHLRVEHASRVDGRRAARTGRAGSGRARHLRSGLRQWRLLARRAGDKAGTREPPLQAQSRRRPVRCLLPRSQGPLRGSTQRGWQSLCCRMVSRLRTPASGRVGTGAARCLYAEAGAPPLRCAGTTLSRRRRRLRRHRRSREAPTRRLQPS